MPVWRTSCDVPVAKNCSSSRYCYPAGMLFVWRALLTCKPRRTLLQNRRLTRRTPLVPTRKPTSCRFSPRQTQVWYAVAHRLVRDLEAMSAHLETEVSHRLVAPCASLALYARRSFTSTKVELTIYPSTRLCSI